MTKYYHVYIKTLDGRETYKVDLTEGDLIKTIAEPINNDQKFICDRLVIIPRTITDIVIKEVDQPSTAPNKKLALRRVLDNFAANTSEDGDSSPPPPKEYYLLKMGTNVTDRFITFQKSTIPKKQEASNEGKIDALSFITLTITGFPHFAQKLKKRRSARTPLQINDEYDLQDLMYALLSLRFGDLRKEEETPSFAGKSSRIDFLLKEDRIVIETKLATEKLTEKEISKQLIEDIARYRSHPDCKILVCFVYDPDRIILNGRGLANDLEKLSSPDLSVKAFVV